MSTYSAIIDDSSPVTQYPALLAFVPTEWAEEWVAYFRGLETRRIRKKESDTLKLPTVIKAEEITNEGQLDDLLNQGMRRAQWIPQLPDDLRRAAVDANRSLHGLPLYNRGPEAWWRKPPEEALRDATTSGLLPWLTLEVEYDPA